MRPPANAYLSVVDNTLRASGHFGFEDEAALEDALAQLARAEAEALVIELSNVTFMASPCVRYVVESASASQNAGRNVRIHACGQVLRLMNVVHIERYAEVVQS